MREGKEHVREERGLREYHCEFEERPENEEQAEQHADLPGSQGRERLAQAIEEPRAQSDNRERIASQQHGKAAERIRSMNNLSVPSSNG